MRYDVATMAAMYTCDTHVDLHIQNILICYPNERDMNMLYFNKCCTGILYGFVNSDRPSQVKVEIVDHLVHLNVQTL